MRIEIATNYFPQLTAWHVRKALKWIDPEDLRGLECLRIMDFEPQDPNASTQPPYLRGFLYNGRYLKEDENRAASIALYTRDLYFGIPLLLTVSSMATLEIASTLAHEVGHHVIASRGHLQVATGGPRSRPSTKRANVEREADEYAADVVSKMLKHPYYRMGRLFCKILSRFYFERGVAAHWKGNFRRAASLHFRAYIINPENSDAGQSYLRDRQAILTSSLTDSERLWIYHRHVKSDPPKELT